MATGPITVKLDTRALKAFRKRVERYQGQPLERRLSLGVLEAARLLVPPVRANAPKGPTGNLRKSIRAGASSRRGGDDLVTRASKGALVTAYVGPSSRKAPHRHLVIRGHRIVTTTGRDTGRRSVANPFVDEAVRSRQGEALRVVSRALFGEG